MRTRGCNPVCPPLTTRPNPGSALRGQESHEWVVEGLEFGVEVVGLGRQAALDRHADEQPERNARRGDVLLRIDVEPPQPLLPETVDGCGPLDRELTRIIDSQVLSAIARKAWNAGRRKYTQVRWVNSVTLSCSVEASMATGSISTRKSCMPRSNTAPKIAFTSPNGCWIAAHVTPDPRAGHPACAASRCWAHRSGVAGPSRTTRDPRFTGRPGFRTPAGRRCSGGAARLGEGSRGRLSELGPAAERRGPAELRLPGSCERGLIASQSRPVGERRAVARRSLDEDRGRLRPL